MSCMYLACKTRAGMRHVKLRFWTDLIQRSTLIRLRLINLVLFYIIYSVQNVYLL